MQKSESYKKLVWLLLMTVYICALLYITLFSRSRTIIRLVSFNPFRAFVLWFEGNAAKGKAILQNVALFVPFGYILFAFQRRKKIVFGYAILPGLCISTLIEVIQYYTGRGTSDAGDILNNTIGTGIGFVLHWIIAWVEDKSGRYIIQLSGGILLIITAIFGCYEMYRMVGNINPDVSQFDFRISSVENTNDVLTFSGTCLTYYIPTPDYGIYVKGEEIYRADTVIKDTSFKATIHMPITGKYEVLIKFQGFPLVSTAVFINDGKVNYVSEKAPEIDDPRLEGSVLKAYSDNLDVLIFQKSSKLIWLIGYDIDDTTEIIYHVDTNEKEKLPGDRIQYGFDNLGFHATQNEVEPIGHYRVFVKELPETYNITGVTVGFNAKGRLLWSHGFRVEE